MQLQRLRRVAALMYSMAGSGIRTMAVPSSSAPRQCLITAAHCCKASLAAATSTIVSLQCCVDQLVLAAYMYTSLSEL
jgi:hypothetical protein